MQICVLTMSSKGDGICLSGYDVENGNWIRLVSNEEGDAISRDLMDTVKILDVIEFDIVKHVPIRWNKENIIGNNIKIVGKKTEYEVFCEYGIDNDDLLFDDGKYYVYEENLPKLKKTLMIINVKDAIIETKLDSQEECIQYMEFKYHGRDYHLKITDLAFPYTSRDDLTGTKLENIIVVCSVQGKLKPNSHCYKFACQIFDIKNKLELINNIRYKGEVYE